MKTVLITGASSGIGKATAELFLQEGWNVVATMRNPDAAGEIGRHPNALIAALDVTDHASIKHAVALAVERFGHIDVLLNNAGYGAYGPLEAFSMDRIERVFDTNVIGVMATMKAVIPGMRERGSGTIINVSSVGGEVAFPTGSLYHGTKFAVEGLSEAISYELASVGIKMRIIQPGFVMTNFGGTGFDRADIEGLPDYEAVTAGTGRLFGALATSASEPQVVAKVILDAANDTSDRLRYRAGEDPAIDLMDTRKQQDDETFSNMFKRLMQGSD